MDGLGWIILHVAVIIVISCVCKSCILCIMGKKKSDRQVSSEEDANTENANVTSNSRVNGNFNPTSNRRVNQIRNWVNLSSEGNGANCVNLSNSRVNGHSNPSYSNNSRSFNFSSEEDANYFYSRSFQDQINRSSTAGVDHEVHWDNWVNLSSEGIGANWVNLPSEKTEDNSKTIDLPPSYEDLFGEK